MEKLLEQFRKEILEKFWKEFLDFFVETTGGIPDGTSTRVNEETLGRIPE